MSSISYNDETWYSYTLPKEDSKNIWITWRTPWFLLTSVFFFFTKDQQILLHQEIQIQIANWYINSICFNLFWICKNFFNKHDCNFDDVSKNGFSWTFYRQDFEKKHVKDTKMSLKGKKRKCEKRSETNMKISVKKKQKLREYMKKYYMAHKK